MHPLLCWYTSRLSGRDGQKGGGNWKGLDPNVQALWDSPRHPLFSETAAVVIERSRWPRDEKRA